MDQNLIANFTTVVSVDKNGLIKQINHTILSYILVTLTNGFVILITHFKKSFNITVETKKIVFLFCYTGLFFNIWSILTTLIYYIISLTSQKMNIFVVDVLEQFFFVLYNIYFITPFCITYWRFVLIYFNRVVLLPENICIAIITLIPSFVAFIDSVFFSNIVYSDGVFEHKHYYSSDLFVYMDILPQVTSSVLALFLNIMILMKVKMATKRSNDKSTVEKSEIPLTINLLFHSICPLILLVWGNLMIILGYIYNENGERTLSFMVFNKCDMIYRIISPITMIAFIEVYRYRFLKWFGYEYKKKLQSLKITTFIKYR
uniref:G-protein coupled receptors family 1 profile domain-containing protein n=1 Tax=Strongyloides stercoralis TaxID=6248 RepID=A0A0K0ES36_STRER